MAQQDKTANPLKREPVLIAAVLVYLVTDALTGTGLNSSLGALLGSLGTAALRFVVTSPATAEVLKAQKNQALGQSLPE